MKQLYIISFLLFLIGFYGCYDDEGNYDYTEVFEIRIDSMKASYTLYTLVDTLRIVTRRERRLSMVRVDMMAGTLQPKPMMSGMNDLP